MCPRTRGARGNEPSGGSIKIFQVITHVRGRSKNRYFYRTICTTRAPPGDPYYREGAIGDARCCGRCCWFCSAMDVLPIWSRWWCHCCWERRSLRWKSCMVLEMKLCIRWRARMLSPGSMGSWVHPYLSKYVRNLKKCLEIAPCANLLPGAQPMSRPISSALLMDMQGEHVRKDTEAARVRTPINCIQ